MTDWIKFTVNSSKKTKEVLSFLNERGFTNFINFSKEFVIQEVSITKKCHFFLEKTGNVVAYPFDFSQEVACEELIDDGFTGEAIEEYYERHNKFPPNYMKKIAFDTLKEAVR